MNAYLSRSLLATSLLLSFGVAQEEQQPPKPKKAGTKPAIQADPEGVSGKHDLDGANARPATKESLFRVFAAIQSLSADYTENKYLSLLAVPLKSKGKLHYMQPGYLSRIVASPERSKLTITKSELRIAGKDKEEVIDLRQSDRVRLFVTSLVQVFQGDEKSLTQHYRIRYTLSAVDHHTWQLELNPIKKPLTQIMKKLLLVGQGKAVTRIELHEPNGDRTITKIFKANPKRIFTVEEQKDIFGITAKSKSGSDKQPKPKGTGAKTNKAGAPR